MAISKTKRRLRIKRGIRKKISGTSDRPRLSVYRSNKAIYAQAIDDTTGTTIAAISSSELGMKSFNIASSKEVGKKLAEKMKESGVDQAVFDRNGYAFHGNVKALAEGVREGGLKL